jgi:hypothetical protein
MRFIALHQLGAGLDQSGQGFAVPKQWIGIGGIETDPEGSDQQFDI